MKLHHWNVDKATLYIVFFFGLCIRLLYLNTLEISGPIRGDASSYAQYASNIIEYGVFSKEHSLMPKPDSYWAPGYPAFLAICMYLSKIISIHFYHIALVLQALIGGMIGAVAYSLGRLILPVGWSLTACGLIVVSPHLITHGGYVLSEIQFSFLLLGALFLYFKSIINVNSLTMAGFGGLLMGFSYLTNPVCLFTPLFLTVVYLSSNKKSIVIHKKLIVVFLIPVVLVVGVWAVRNAIVVEDASLSSSDRAFENLVIGSHKEFHNIVRNNPNDRNNPYFKDVADYRDNHLGFFSVLTTRVRESPVDYANWYLLTKPIELWGWDVLVGYGDVYVYKVDSSLYEKSKLALASLVMMKQMHYWILFFALISIAFVKAEVNPFTKIIVLSLYVTIVSISAIYVLLHTDARYSVPLRPEMYICAVYSMFKLVALIKNLHQKYK